MLCFSESMVCSTVSIVIGMESNQNKWSVDKITQLEKIPVMEWESSGEQFQ